MAKSHIGIRKFQLTTATMAVVAATTLTPMVAQAAPSFGSFVEGIGDSASLVVEPVVIASRVAAKPITSTGPRGAVAAPTATDCAQANFSLGCYLVQGVVAGTQAIVRGVVVIVGTAAYVVVAGTGELLQLVGEILPGPIGNFFTNVGDGVSTLAANIGQAIHVGPYSTSE